MIGSDCGNTNSHIMMPESMYISMDVSLSCLLTFGVGQSQSFDDGPFNV